jgi:hypothetical protein
MRAWDYPYPVVVVRCDACHREGRYRKQRFLDLVGAHTALPDALRIVAKDCPRAGRSLTDIHGRCQACYPDLRDGASRGAAPAGPSDTPA